MYLPTRPYLLKFVHLSVSITLPSEALLYSLVYVVFVYLVPNYDLQMVNDVDAPLDGLISIWKYGHHYH